MAVSFKPKSLIKHRFFMPLLRGTLTAIAISFLLSALSLYLFDITELSRLELLILALSLPAVITPLISWQHAQRGTLIESMQEELKEASRHDDLTGLLSRRTFLETAQKELLLASRHSYTVSLVILGIDHFDELKQNYNRLLADHAFRSCAGLLKTSLRETDTLARYGEESFVLLMPHTELEQAREVVTRLQETVGQKPLRLERQDISVTLSGGISLTQEGSYNLENLSEQAERALARAKSQGKNQLEVLTQPVAVRLESSSN